MYLRISINWFGCFKTWVDLKWEFLKEKKESKKTRKHAFDQESDQEEKEKNICIQFGLINNKLNDRNYK